ncbi:MAG: urease accessory protein UreD [Roseivivax sp.]|nr:urease accessory protein UreD [Roseivivax sp.]
MAPQRPEAAPPRARGTLRLSSRLRDDGASVLDGLHMAGSVKALFPRGTGAAMQTVLLNTAGGITGGDAFDIEVSAGPGSHLVVTTQAAERIYRAAPGVPGRITTRLSVAEGATLGWLPQETILFDAAALDRRLLVDAAPGARVLACEALVFGRAAMGERVRSLHLRDRIDLRLDGALAFADRLRLDGDAAARLERDAVAGGAHAMASLVLSAPGAARQLDAMREALGATGGASALSGDLVFARLLAEDSFALRARLIPMLTDLTQTAIPKTWTL